jgi:flagellar assembly protein FliH
MSSPEPVRFTSWPVPELRLMTDRPSAPAEPAGPTPEEEAYSRGLEQGRRAAQEECDRRTLAARQALAGAAESLQAVRAAFASEAEESVYALATALAQQIVQREIASDPSIVRDLVRQAIQVLPLEGTLEIRLHPSDLSALGGELDLYAPGGRKLDLRWVAEPGIERGGYLIETPQRVVDGRIDPVLVAMYQRLRDV